MSNQMVEAIEAKYGVSLPLDLREFYSIVDGMDDGETDDQLFRLFPLNVVKPVTDELVKFRGIPDYSGIKNKLSNPESYFVFAEYLIMSHVYAIRLSSSLSASTPVIWTCGSRWAKIAATFSEFAEKYLEDRDALLTLRL